MGRGHGSAGRGEQWVLCVKAGRWMGRHALDRAMLASWSATELLKEVADSSWSATELRKEATDSSWSDGDAAGVDVVGCCRGRAELTEEIVG
ncbi:hypothetical protein ACLOJK_023057 [Asimina triloba]